MDKVMAELDMLKARWMTGGACTGLGPDEWRDLGDLSLLALTGQFIRIATLPATASDMENRPDIPAIPLPTMPEELRPQFRRVLQAKLADPADVVRLIAARGYCVNPLDWMPKRSDTLPDAYVIWRDWLEGSWRVDDDQALTPDTWDLHAPSNRYITLTAMHASDPQAARDLITAVAPTLAAEQRLRMLTCLRQALTEDDATLLTGYLTDRSSKVQAFVKQQLARLGQTTETDDTAAAEVTDYLEVMKAGMLSRKSIISARKLKTNPQRKRRHDILTALSVTQVANALGQTADDLIAMWDLGDATAEICHVVATTGTDGQAEALTGRLVANGSEMHEGLIERLTPNQRTQHGLTSLQSDNWGFENSRQWFPTPDGTVSLATLSKASALPDLIKRAARSDKPADEHRITQALTFLGLIADRDAARSLIDRLTAAGLLAVDPRLTLLRLNAAL